MLLPIHVVAGGLAIILGGTALIASKGGGLHRKSGLLFVYAMLTMGISGSVLALRQSLTNTNVIGGFMSAYFVVTALMAVRPFTPGTRRVTIGALVLALALAVYLFSLGVAALGMPRRALNGVPFFMLFFLGTIVSLAVLGDVRAIRAGVLKGSARMRRHLWRMCFALFIAAGSFFSIRARVAKVLPEPFTTPGMRALPVLLIFGAMFYWLWRVRRRRYNASVERLTPWFASSS
jgi:hypothetical protein